MKFDIVGDVHGYSEHFIRLLEHMDYSKLEGLWQHPERTLISVGDIIDRGPGQREIVDTLKPMQEAGKAIVLMGNHEFYAIAWYLKNTDGQPLRPHSEKNTKEHAAFLDQALEGSPWYLATIEWLKTLPLFFENEAFRCVHAAWDEHHINTLRPFCDDKGVLKPEIWDQLEHMDRSFFKALDYCLNGSKLQLPDGHSFTDSGGRQRYKARLKWWDITHPATFKNACTSVPNLEQLPNEAVDISLLPSIDGDTPIFFGHYWMQGKPHLMSTKFACLDWSVVLDDGVLAAYRFDGEQELEEHKLTWV